MLALGTNGLASAQGWSHVPGQSRPRMGHSMAYDSDRELVVLFGGGMLVDHRDTWEFDGTAWRPGAPSHPSMKPRSQAAMVYDTQRRRLVVFGGYNDGLGLDDTWESDGTAWQRGPAAPPGLTGRHTHAMAYDSRRGRAVLFGGTAGSYDLRDTWEYDGATWMRGPDAPDGLGTRREHVMAFDQGRGLVVLACGLGGMLRNDAWEYDGAAWTAGAPAPPTAPGRTEAAMVYDAARARMLIYGGTDGGTVRLGDMWSYDGASWTEIPVYGPLPRLDHGMAYDARRDRVVVHAGNVGAIDLNDDTWEFDGAAWSEVLEATAPGERVHHVMAYDALQGRVVLHGGDDRTRELEDTWGFDGTGWSMISSSSAIGARAGHSMVFDEARGRLVLFGDESWSRDTWEMVGDAWVPGTTGPPALLPRAHAAMVYDRPRSRIVLFGGEDSQGNLLDDTWLHDGTGWTQVAAGGTAPDARAMGSMAFDERRGVSVLVGGYSAGGYLGDTWELDGTLWRPSVSLPNGLALAGHAMAYHATRGRVVLFGGAKQSTEVLPYGTWELDGTSWLATATGLPEPRWAAAMTYDRGHRRVVLFGGEDYDLIGETWLHGGEVPDLLAGQGGGAVNTSRVRTFDQSGTPGVVDFLAYGAAGWGANVGLADVDGAEPPELLTGPGPGTILGPHVRAFGSLGAPLPGGSFYAYGTLRHGVEVLGGDVDGAGADLAITGPGPGTIFGPHVRAWQLGGGVVVPIGRVNFFAYATLRYGVNGASADVDADGAAEIVTGPGPGTIFGPHVRGWNVDGGNAGAIPALSFSAFASGDHGARVTAGQATSGGAAEIAAAPGPSPSNPARVAGFAFDGASVTALPGFDVVAFPGAYGTRPAIATDFGAASGAALWCAPGPDPASPAALRSFQYDGAALNPDATVDPFSGAPFGASVASADLGL